MIKRPGSEPIRFGSYEPREIKQPKLEYSALSEKALSYMKSRGISASTCELAGLKSCSFYSKKLASSTEGIAFPYKGGWKIRAIDVKDFSIDGSIEGFFRAVSPDYSGKLVLTEGEIDALSFLEAGITAYSLPHGAVGEGQAGGLKLECLEEIEGEDAVVVALDRDEPGAFTAEEIKRRLGRDKVWSIPPAVFAGAKDANDLLKNKGPGGISDAVHNAEPYPIEGLFGADHFASSVKELYIKGLGKGSSTGYRVVDELYSISGGQLSVVTGAPSSGKSEFIDQIMVNLAVQSGWKFAIASFENPPNLHIAKLCSKREAEPFFSGPTKRMDEHKLERSLSWVREHFYFIHDSHGSTSDLDSILDRLKSAVKRYGINGAVIDPYNYITRPNNGDSETQWISDLLTKVCAFAKAYNIHIWFVAHPSKMQRLADGSLPVPKGWEISGSAAWFAKADFGITVHRPDPVNSNAVEIHVWKCRFSWMGKQGVARLNYVPASYNYVEDIRPHYADMDF